MEMDLALDRIIHEALAFAARFFDISYICDPGPSQNSLRTRGIHVRSVQESLWIAKWVELTCKRLGLACFWVHHHSGSPVAMKARAIETLGDLENDLKIQFGLLVHAVAELGAARCINRYQLVFFELSRYRLVRKGLQQKEPSLFLM